MYLFDIGFLAFLGAGCSGLFAGVTRLVFIRDFVRVFIRRCLKLHIFRALENLGTRLCGALRKGGGDVKSRPRCLDKFLEKFLNQTR